MLDVTFAKAALMRARSRVRSVTLQELNIPNLKITKVYKSSQKKSTIYLANRGVIPLVAKFFVEGALSDFEHECSMCTDIPPHPHIVELTLWKKLLESHDRRHCGVLIFPYYRHCLADLISDSQETLGDDVLSIAQGIIFGLNHMHKHRFIHCDIKPGNIMFDQAGKLIIIDLGSAVRSGEPVIEHTSSYSLGLHLEAASPRLDWVCTAATLFGCQTGCVPSSIDQILTYGKETDHPIGKIMIRLCKETSDEIIDV
jgi:serine/threonine protein kinase